MRYRRARRGIVHGSKSEREWELVPIFIMGKRYEVPSSLTIQKALEYADINWSVDADAGEGYAGPADGLPVSGKL